MILAPRRIPDPGGMLSIVRDFEGKERPGHWTASVDMLTGMSFGFKLLRGNRPGPLNRYPSMKPERINLVN